MDFLGGSVIKNPPDNMGEADSITGSGRSPGEGNGNQTQAFWPGKSHEQRSMADYSS